MYGTQKDYADIIGISPTLLARYLNGASLPGAEVLKKVMLTGVSVNWLLGGEGIMFANNEAGFALRDNFEKYNIEPQTNPYGRIKKWIKQNYGSLKNFALLLNLDYDEIHNMLYNDVITTPAFIKQMRRAGCSINWIISGDGDPYASNPVGKILKSEFENLRDWELLERQELEDAMPEEILELVKTAIDREEEDSSDD